MRAAFGAVMLLASLAAPVSAAGAQTVPGAPDVEAEPGHQSVTLTWRPASDGGARIIRWEYTQTLPVTTNVWLQIPGSGPDTTSYTVAGLTNGTPYQFAVRAVTLAGNGSPGVSRAGTGASGEETVSPSTTPGPPIGLAGKAENSEVALMWTAAVTSGAGRNDGFSPIISYEIRQKTGDRDYSPWTVMVGSGPATASHAVTGLTNGVVYQFEVRARNANGSGAAAETRPLLVATVPGPPRELVGEAGNKRALLKWTASSNGGAPVTSWQYRQGTGSADIADAAAWVTIPGSHADTTSHPVVSLDNSLAYQFEVRAVNDVGPGAAAATGVVQPGTAPAKPVGFAVSLKEGTTDTAVLTWRRPNDGGSPIVGYQYSQRAGSGGYGPWRDVPESRPDTGSHEVGGLAAGTAYRFRVRAVNAVGGGAAATAAKAFYPGTAPRAPGLLRVADSYDAAKGTRLVTLRWTPGDDGGPPVTRWEYKYSTSAEDLSTFYEDQGWVAICDTAIRRDAGCASKSSVTVPRSAAELGALRIPVGSDGPELDPVAGETYYVQIRAVNESGAGLPSGIASTSIPRIIPSTPPAVYIQDAAADSFRVWWPPSSDGGTNTDIAGTDVHLRYQVSYRAGGSSWSGWQNVEANWTTIENAVRGTRYWVRVRAENAVGLSGIAESAGYTHGGPPTPGADVVGAVPSVTARATANQVALSLVRSANAGNIGGITASTWWEYSYKVGEGDYGRWTFNNAGHWFADVAVDGLENGEPHTFRIRGVNAELAGPSLESEEVVPGSVPQAPVGLQAAAGDRSVTLAWTPSGDGLPITKWQVCELSNANPCGDVETGEGWTDILDSGPATTGHTIESLANGTAYTFLVRAWNDRGWGTRAQTRAVTPGRVPDPPARVQVSAGNGQITVTVTAPSDEHDSPVTGYQFRKKAADGAWDGWQDADRDGSEATTVATVTGVANGISYTLEVRAVNAFGPGGAAEPASVTPMGPPPAGTLSAEPGNAHAALAWMAGGDGGSAITRWEYRQKQAGRSYGAWLSIPGSGPATAAHTVAGLDNGTAYTFQVRAVNRLGAGEPFESGPVIPALVPPPPAAVAATRGDGQVTLAWRPGAADGPGAAGYAAPTTGWQYRVKAGGGVYGKWVDIADSSAATTSHTVAGLDNGTAYVFGVRAVNDVGAGPAGSAEAIPATVPAAPAVTAAGGDGEVSVSWAAGVDGGLSVTAWQYRIRVGFGDYGDWTEVSSDTSSVTLTGLGGGTGTLSYTFQVRAVNGVGEGAAGTSGEAVPVEMPPATAVYYSGVVTHPGFCADFSLGGARLFAHDSDGDGVADVCSLPYTRREAIARQSAVDALVGQYPDEYTALVNAACAIAEDGAGGDAVDGAICGGEMLAAPPAVPINEGGPFYSGIITGPSFCANRSLGGPTTYPHDSDGDGVADVCALPYTRREAIARQLASDVLAATYPADFRRELATACRVLTGADYGDDAEDLANDACA